MAIATPQNGSTQTATPTTPTPSLNQPKQRQKWGPHWGTACGLMSALFYSIAHLALRQVVHIDPILVSTVKTLPSILLGGLLVIWVIATNRRLISTGRDVARLIGAAALAHFAGNVVFQWALGVVGLAIGVPVTLGSLLIGSAIFGRVILAEAVSRRSTVTMVIVIASIVILSLGSNSAAAALNPSAQPTPWHMIALAVIGFCVAGLAYSTLGVTVRWTGTRGMPLATTMLLSGLTGAILMGTICGWRLETSYYTTQVSASDWLIMGLAAISNVVAFLSIITALHLAKLLHVNLLNAAQSAFAAIAGVLIFAEPLSWTLVLGVSLMGVGFAYASRGKTR